MGQHLIARTSSRLQPGKCVHLPAAEVANLLKRHSIGSYRASVAVLTFGMVCPVALVLDSSDIGGHFKRFASSA